MLKLKNMSYEEEIKSERLSERTKHSQMENKVGKLEASTQVRRIDN